MANGIHVRIRSRLYMHRAHEPHTSTNTNAIVSHALLSARAQPSGERPKKKKTAYLLTLTHSDTNTHAQHDTSTRSLCLLNLCVESRIQHSLIERTHTFESLRFVVIL